MGGEPGARVCGVYCESECTRQTRAGDASEPAGGLAGSECGRCAKALLPPAAFPPVLASEAVLGLRSGFESPGLDRPGRLPHQQGLCEARLGYRDGSPQLGAPGPGLERACRHCIIIRHTTRAEGDAACKGLEEGGGWRAHRGWCCEEGRWGRERKGVCLPGACAERREGPCTPGSRVKKRPMSS